MWEHWWAFCSQDRFELCSFLPETTNMTTWSWHLELETNPYNRQTLAQPVTFTLRLPFLTMSSCKSLLHANRLKCTSAGGAGLAVRVFWLVLSSFLLVCLQGRDWRQKKTHGAVPCHVCQRRSAGRDRRCDWAQWCSLEELSTWTQEQVHLTKIEYCEQLLIFYQSCQKVKLYTV